MTDRKNRVLALEALTLPRVVHPATKAFHDGIGPPMSAEEWEEHAAQQQAELMQRTRGGRVA